MEIRTARSEDCGRFTEIARLAKGSWGYPAEWLKIWENDLTIAPEYIEKNAAFAAVDGETIVGLCVLEDHGHSWTLEHVWVDPRQHRSGVGRSLVAHALAIAASRRTGSVLVLSDTFAEPFYLRLGARKVRDVPAPMPGAPTRTLPLLEFVV